MGVFNEDSRVKFPTIKYLMEMGYKYISFKGVEIKSKNAKLEATLVDKETNILPDILKSAYLRLNAEKTEEDFKALLAKIQNSLRNDDLGRQFYKDYLLNPDVKIVDFSNAENFRVNNTFQVTTELTCGNKDSDNFRPDITLFINGLPLAFIEVKKENNSEGIQAETARMKNRFKIEAFRPYLNITQIMVFSNDMEYAQENRPPEQGAYYAAIGRRDTKYSTFREEGQDSFPLKIETHAVSQEDEALMLTDNNVPMYIAYDEYKQNCENINTPTKRICKSLFSFERFHFLLKYGIAYADYSFGLQKHIMRYPQLFATKAIERMLDKGGNKGIIWHTQGSGKTALTYYNVKYLTDYFHKQEVIPQFFFIVDRLDLMVQAQMEFSVRGLNVVSVQSKEEFRDIISSPRLTQNQQGKLEITVVNIQKFSTETKALSKLAYNLKIKRIYFIDEAHRNYNPKGSFLKNLLSSDENAVIIALTGTPIIQKDINTKDIFGDYIHTYYYNASISDGYTLRLQKERITSNFKGVMNETLAKLQVNKKHVQIEDIYAHKNYVQPLLDYIVQDLKNFRIAQGDQSLAGMIVCNCKEQAITMYQYFLEKYADQSEVNKYYEDGEYFIESVGPEKIESKKVPLSNGRYRAALILCDVDGKDARRAWIDLFKEGLVDFLIVFKMLQTGFDAPRLKKLYLNRNVRAHNLLQTLTRVNRPYKNINYGYVVDFADIEEEYEKTNGQYQKELEAENGKECLDTSNKLFISPEEAQSQIETAINVLDRYDLQNATVFSKELNRVESVEELNKVLKSLTLILELQNMLLTQGSDTNEIIQFFEKRCNFAEIKNFIKATKNRIIFLNYKKFKDDSLNVKKLLNVAIENITFNFVSSGEPKILELAGQYKEAVEYTRKLLLNNFDHDDPIISTLEKAFLDEITKNGITDANDPVIVNQLNLHKRVETMNKLIEQIRRKNEEDNILSLHYKGDRKYVRIEKRLTEKAQALKNSNSEEAPLYSFTENKEKLQHMLLDIKNEVDGSFFLNQNIKTNWFKRCVLQQVSRSLIKESINSDQKLRSYVEALISNEYTNTYREIV